MKAWDISLEHYNGTMDMGLICQVAREIDQRLSGYRNESVRIAGKENIYVMTNPAKVEREMNKLLSYVNNPDIRILERALCFHLYFSLIHPLSDGNGRTSRLMQNMILYHNDITQ
ncbi:Fic family protein [Candidatus Woesearchaeota archaeon]|nr:Fic family protein [Candidatus Woesearchaeota archaeon]